MLAMLFMLAVCVQPGAVPAPATALQAVSAFEQNLGAVPKEKTTERAELIRAFVAALRERDAKLAAIDITDNRYVYVLSPTETGLLLGPLLHDQDERVCRRALRAIGLNGLAGEHVEQVTALLKQSTVSQLPDVITAMARSRDERYWPHLRALLKHDEGTIRGHTVFEMRALPRAKMEPLFAALWHDPHQQVRYNLTWFYAQDTAKLCARLKDPSPHVRECALRIIGETRNAAAAKEVTALANDPETLVRGQLATALGLLKDPMHIAVLSKLLDDRDVYPRRMAVQALAQYQDGKLAPLFVKMLADADDQVREYAARALGKLQAPEQAKALLPLLSDETIAVRFEAAVTLIRLAGAEYAPQIHRMAVAVRADRRFGYGDGFALIRAMDSEVFLPTLALLAENELWRDSAVQRQQQIRARQIVPNGRGLP